MYLCCRLKYLTLFVSADDLGRKNSQALIDDAMHFPLPTRHGNHVSPVRASRNPIIFNPYQCLSCQFRGVHTPDIASQSILLK